LTDPTAGFIRNPAATPWWFSAFDSLQEFSILPTLGSHIEKEAKFEVVRSKSEVSSHISMTCG
jgi:hypothetical protein